MPDHIVCLHEGDIATIKAHQEAFAGKQEEIAAGVKAIETTLKGNGKTGMCTDLELMKQQMTLLSSSPWRMAIPPISYKALGVFVIAMTLILRGNVDAAIKAVLMSLGLG